MLGRVGVGSALTVVVLAGCNGGQTEAKVSHPPVVLHAIAYSDGEAVWIDPAGDGPPRRVAEGRNPNISPDGRYLAYVELRDGSDWLRLVSIGFEGSSEVLSGAADYASQVTWARDAPVVAMATPGV